MDEMDRLVEGDALADAKANAAAHQSEVQCHDRSRSCGLILPSVSFSQRGGLASASVSDSTSAPAAFSAGEIGKIGAKLAFDDDQPVGRKRRDVGAEAPAQYQPR